MIFVSGALLFAASCKPGKKEDKATVPMQFTCYPARDSISIDGEINTTEWADADSILVYDDSLRIPNRIVVRSLWDKKFLYFSFDVKDSNLLSIQTALDHPLLAKDDIVEFLIDTKNDKDSCWDENDIIYHINLAGQKKDDRGTAACRSDSKWNGIANISVKHFGTVNDNSDIDTGYAVEVAVPWTEIEQQPKDGLVMGVNFGGQSDGVFFDWVDAWPFRQPFAFGNLKLKNAK